MNQTILITGASSGIGRGIAVALAKSGCRVYAGVRNAQDSESLKKEHENIYPLLLDVTDDQQVNEALSAIVETSRPLDALINNAGLGAGGPIEGVGMEAWERVFQVNVFGAVRLTRAFLPLLRKSKGRVINISSVSGLLALPYLSVYAASKFALEAFSDALRREAHAFGVRVSIIQPGPIKTAIWQKGIAGSSLQSFNMSAEAEAVYSAAFSKYSKIVESKEAEALSVSAVVRVVKRALTCKNPKIRYVVSNDSWHYKIMRFLPTSVIDKFIYRMFS